MRARNWQAGLALAIAASLATPAGAAPGDMSVATFLAKYEALKKKGLFALGSSDISALKAEGEAGGAAYRARIAADKAAGRAPHSCPPARPIVGQSEFLASLQRYPVAERGATSIKMAVADLMKRKYPC